MAEHVHASYEPLPAGTRVEVRDRFDRSFHPGFEVTNATESGYQLLRLSDRAQLPTVFAVDDVRPVG